MDGICVMEALEPGSHVFAYVFDTATGDMGLEGQRPLGCNVPSRLQRMRPPGPECLSSRRIWLSGFVVMLKEKWYTVQLATGITRLSGGLCERGRGKKLSGGEYRARTDDLLAASQTLSQLS